MTQQNDKLENTSTTEAGLEQNGSSCSFCADWDGSPEARQKRADELRATIPAEVAGQVSGLIVADLGLCFAKFAAVTEKPKSRIQLDRAVYRLANGHPQGILCAYIEFENGAKIKFDVAGFKEFIPAPAGQSQT